MDQAMSRVLNVLTFGLMLSTLLPVGANAEKYSEMDPCGIPDFVSEYVLELQGATIVMPEFGRFLVDGASTYEAAFKERWAHEYTGAGVFFHEDATLLLQYRNDCVDFYASRIYVFDGQGQLMVSDDVWTAHWEDAFYFDADRLSFWSEWFCSEHNEDAQTASYIMQHSSDSEEFVRIPRTREENCSPAAIEEFRNRRITFDWFSPDRTLIRDPRLK